jgi:protein tyrosine phosphatase (PTP) superfamily phosphohydrolase (DUF442 family)
MYTSLQDIYNFIQLDERLGTSGQPKEDQLPTIAQAGYQCVINLAMPNQDYSLPDEKGSVEALGMEYVAFPVVWQNPLLANFDEFCQAMNERKDQKLFVHCAANMRVSAFMALYRIIELGWEPEKAYQDLRRIWTPDGLWKDFMNQALARAGKDPVSF